MLQTKADTTKIADYIISSAEKYYNYLFERDKGIELVKVSKVTRKDEFIFNLTFQRKIQDFDFVTTIRFDGKEVDISKFKVLSSSYFSVDLAVRENQINLFSLSNEIFVVIDFKQLVWRIRDSFVNDKTIHLPRCSPELNFDFKRFNNVPFTAPQRKAIENIFSSPLSYIWGGAGSGKTRFVLSYAIINYALNNKPVLLVAPTNIALENALSAIIPVAKTYGIDTSKFFRAGTPSQDFYSNYPECCRFSALNNQLKILTKKRDDLAMFVTKKENMTILYEIESLIELQDLSHTEIARLEDESEELSLGRNLLQKQLKDAEIQLRTVNALVNAYNAKKNSFLYKIKKELKLTSQMDANLNKSLDRLEEINNAVINLKTKIEEANEKLQYNKTAISELQADIKHASETIRRQLLPIAKNAFDAIDYKRLRFQIKEYEKKCEYYFSGIIKLYSKEINLENLDEIKKLICNYSFEIEQKLLEKEQHEKDRLIFACTLDSLAIRPGCELDYAHIFLDEACYASAAKTTLLFKLGRPITFLGDHMQLPPVAEFNDVELDDPELQSLFLWAQSGIYTCDLFNLDFEKMYKDYINNVSDLSLKLSVSNLSETHRFGRQLAKVLDRHVYNSGFASALSTETKVLVIDAPRKTPTTKKRENIDEANAICNYLKQNTVKDFAILTPYVNQALLLKKTLKNIESDNILSIHKSQGQEWDTIILSISDTEDKFFTNSKNKISRGKQLLNTAISRTKNTLIIVCDVAYWKSLDGQLISELLRIGQTVKVDTQ